MTIKRSMSIGRSRKCIGREGHLASTDSRCFPLSGIGEADMLEWCDATGTSEVEGCNDSKESLCAGEAICPLALYPLVLFAIELMFACILITVW